MDTINNVAVKAAKAVWGEGEADKEPVSGAGGDVSKGEPYDAGNLESNDQNKVASDMDGDAENKPKTEGEDPDTVSPDQLTGPGPKPIEQVAKEHGGDAAAVAEDTTKTEDAGKPAETKTDDKAAAESEEVVKSTGLAADGGDFDATKPGAGREAERLMEQKGMKPTEGKKDATADETNGAKPAEDASKTSKKDKRMSLGQRIKAKFSKK